MKEYMVLTTSLSFLLGVLATVPVGTLVYKDLQKTQAGLRVELTEMTRQRDVLHDGAEAEYQRIKVLKAENEALTTPDFQEALRLAATWPDICGKLPLGNILQRGDQGCANVLHVTITEKKRFPDDAMRLRVFKAGDAKALRIAREFIADRCRFIENDKPKICAEISG